MSTKRTVVQSILNLFAGHPKDIGETYTQHLSFAMLSGLKLVYGGIACILHAVFPFIFINTASHTVKTLAHDFEHRRNKQ
jgi:small basic protein